MPVGVGSEGPLTLRPPELDKLLNQGMAYTEELGLSWPEDRDVTEEKVSMWVCGEGLGGALHDSGDCLYISRVRDYCVNLFVLHKQGCFPGANAAFVSTRAKQRGCSQCGTMGGGNHYCEVQVSASIIAVAHRWVHRI